MDIQEAKNILKNTAYQFKGTRQEHSLIEEAVQKIDTLVESQIPEPKKEEKK